MKRKLKRKLEAKKQAKLLIPELLKKARSTYKKGNKKLSKTYSKKIRYLCLKYKIVLPNEIKRQLCKNCFSILIPSANCRIRTRDGRLVYYCLECKKYMRIVLKYSKEHKYLSNN